MTDITDEPVVRWMKEAGIADVSHPLVEMFRKVAELAQRAERERFAEEAAKMAEVWDWSLAQSIRARSRS